MARRSIVLEERKQIKIFTNPVRQEMIRLLRLSEVPLTAKDLADRLYLSPAAVQHHLKKLEEMNLYGAITGKALYEGTIDLAAYLKGEC